MRRRGGGKLGKSENVTIRLDPQLRYMAGLVAKGERRTLSNLIEVALEKYVSSVTSVGGITNDDELASASAVMSLTWHIEPSDRLAKLAIHRADLLTPGQQEQWSRIVENPNFWKGKRDGGKWDVSESNLDFVRLRKEWDQISSGSEL